MNKTSAHPVLPPPSPPLAPALSFVPSVRQLRAFVAVYQLKKFSAAAEQLHVTQSAVSLLIRELETGLGVVLFERSTRTLRPTEAAQDACAVAERILRDIATLSTGARELASLQRGRVRIAITPTLGEIVLPQAIQNFRARHAGVHIAIDDCAPDQFVSRVVSEEVDFGIGSPEQDGADVDEEVLLHDHLVAVCPPGHDWAGRRAVRWAELAEQAIITVQPGYGIRPLIDASAAQAGVRLNVVNDVTFLSTALWMAGAGLGVAIMPAAYARRASQPGLHILALRQPQVSRHIALVTKRARALSPAAQALVQEIRTTLAGTVATPQTADEAA